MKFFDERAEATASGDNGGGGNGGGGSNASPAEIKRVRRVLTSKNRKLKDDLISIDVLMSLDGHGDAFVGPPTPDSLGAKRLQERFEGVAQSLRQLRAALTNVDFNSDDKQDMRASLLEAALSWEARAKLARAVDAGRSAKFLDQAGEHDKAAAKHAKHLKAYFADQGGD